MFALNDTGSIYQSRVFVNTFFAIFQGFSNLPSAQTEKGARCLVVVDQAPDNLKSRPAPCNSAELIRVLDISRVQAVGHQGE